MYKLNIKIDLKKSENIHNVHQFVVHQTTVREKGLRNSSPNCKRFLSGSNSYNYNTHLKCICVYKTTTLIEKYNLATHTKNIQCVVLQITQYEETFVVLIHESSQCSSHVQMELVQ